MYLYCLNNYVLDNKGHSLLRVCSVLFDYRVETFVLRLKKRKHNIPNLFLIIRKRLLCVRAEN